MEPILSYVRQGLLVAMVFSRVAPYRELAEFLGFHKWLFWLALEFIKSRLNLAMC